MSTVPQYRPPSLGDADDSYESTVVPFNRRGRGGNGYEGEPPRAAPRRTGQREADGPTEERRPRRQRRRSFEQPPWLWQAVSGVAVAVVILVALVMARMQPGPTATATPTQPPVAANLSPQAPASAPLAETASPAQPAAALAAPPRDVQTSVKVLEANYTVVAGDTLGAIAARFNTTTARIQAFNNLPDPRMLSIDQKLIIPPPL